MTPRPGGDPTDGGPGGTPGPVGVCTVYQPIVDLHDRTPVAVEALTRGRQGETPEALFAAAAAGGSSTAALDEACLRSALIGLQHLAGPASVFVNLEPATLSELDPARLGDLAALAPASVQLVLEVTERALLRRPAHLVRAVTELRARGWRIALDDVGAEPAGLALMPFLQPDVIKLDLALVRGHTSLQAAAVVNGVRAEAERSGALVLAEGIETEQQLERALSMGAQLGQGFLFGRPEPVPTPSLGTLRLRPVPPPDARTRGRTPFELLSAASAPQRARTALLTSMTLQLERQALLLDDQTVVLANWQHADLMTPSTRRRYESLATLTAMTAVTGVQMPEVPVPGVHGTAVDPADPLAEEWVMTVVSPHFAAALAARLVPGTGAGADAAAGGAAGGADRTGAGRGRVLDYVLTYDRDRAVEAAVSLLDRVSPPAVPTVAPRAPDVPVPADAGRRAPRVPERELPGLLTRAMAGAGTGFVIADARRPDLPLVYANEAFLELSGYTAEEVIGRNCRFLQGSDTDLNQVRPLSRRILGGRQVQAVLLNYRRDGTPFWNEVRISAVRDRDGEITHFIGHQLDVTTRVERERHTTYLAYHDELTGLPNRVQLMEHLELEIARSRRSGLGVAAVLLDLDGFKTVNDDHGHAAGDAALAWAAHRLRGAVRSGDLLGRLGGDEFLVVLAGLPAGEPAGAATVQRVRGHLQESLDAPCPVADVHVRLSASSGTALFPGDADGAAGLLAVADAAMYRDKERRRPGSAPQRSG
ncbi:EAL domain-containing protein [Modestobacter sp. I12A-02628]|uniref:EAL domain-containing protein n=1 Tax=Goekera deserti TaxID=2497753 RepID=A0A7K3WHE8_9ACTN|nr:EAL domain-containing protein [Goekera deserti]MPQ99044.1 EAL domain-containing protein [Goekera deserti]NDI47378.1 EAL domain-containing protein [Goekera deserti]NEL55908.1 EAL domain-containing protein [Goekera deserti]